MIDMQSYAQNHTLTGFRGTKTPQNTLAMLSLRSSISKLWG